MPSLDEIGKPFPISYSSFAIESGLLCCERITSVGQEGRRGLMSLLSRIFGSKNNARQSPPVQDVEVHFSYGSKNFQHLYALEEVLGQAISDAGVGAYEGHDVSADGSDGYFYMYGPDAEAIYRVIAPALANSTFIRGAKITLWFGPRKWRTPKRVIHLPA